MKTLQFIIFLFFTSQLSFSQPGTIDMSFGTNGVLVEDFGFNSTLRSMVLQQDAKIITLADGDTINNTNRMMLTRFTQQGFRDSTFGNNGIVVDTFLRGGIMPMALAMQADGKILVTGFSGISNIIVLRFETNGSLDSSFGNGGISVPNVTSQSSTAFEILEDANNKIILSGTTVNPISMSDNFLARLNSNGSIDSTFATNGFVSSDNGGDNDRIYDMVLQVDGKIVVSGRNNVPRATLPSFNRNFVATRYNANGTIDSTFGVAGFATTDLGKNEFGFTLGLQSDGKIVVGGLASPGQYALIRYTTDGILDSTFGDNGVRLSYSNANQGNGVGAELAIQEDDKIILVGSEDPDSTYDFAVLRFSAEGNPDSTFGDNGIVITDADSMANTANYVLIQNDGKILVGGSSISYDSPINPKGHLTLARYLGDNRVSRPELIEKISLNVYPNPLNETSIIQYELKNAQRITLEIVDMMGRRIRTLHEHVNQQKGIYEYPIFMQDMPNGFYFVTIKGSKQASATLRVMK